ncbi:MAG: MBL fold metallo-hydrolase [Deltaproteobacteria bacterium]|nr:MAG: MBL fold metallo-hydrolase [Deltaproteobacteria bacterium]
MIEWRDGGLIVKVLNLTRDSRSAYTSNAYLVLGNHNALDDLNTLVDVGRDPLIIDRINEAPTGVGKHRVEQVVLTHSHYDHAEALPLIREAFHPVVYAFSASLEGVDNILKGGETLKLGDRMFEVIYTPGHSNDSICLYCEQERTLFAGDTTLIVQSLGGTYEEGYIRALEKLCRRDIRAIYLGHGEPLLKDCNRTLRNTLRNVKKSMEWLSGREGK